MKSHFTLFIFLVLFQIHNVHGQSEQPDQEKKSKKHSLVDLHTRLVLASPNYTYEQLSTVNYDYTDVKAANVGGSVKLQFLNSIYSEYALLFNFYNQTTGQLMLGIETPSKVLRLGARYVFSNYQINPIGTDEESRDIQMYLTLGGPRGGLEVALGNLHEVLSADDNLESFDLTNVKVRLNIALWSTRKKEKKTKS